MAQMIPPYPKEFEEASDEGTVFLALKKLPDDYYVFHSVSVTTVDNGTLYEREIDFVVANQKKGILCIEAKRGAYIRYENRQWLYSSGEPMKHDGPYHQIASAKRVLGDKIKCHSNSRVRDLYSKCRMKHAVFFFDMPESRFDGFVNLPEEACKEITLFESDLLDPTNKIESIFELQLSWERYAINENTITEGDFRLLLDSVLCPAFNLIPSPKSRTFAADYQMNQLLYEQYKLLDFLEDQDSAIINGAAGTGKTMVALEKARRHSMDNEKVLFLCYNVLLCDYLIKTHTTSENEEYRKQFENVDFMTISKLAKDVTGNFRDIEGLKAWLLECYTEPGKFGYRHVIIDEGQDFGIIDENVSQSEAKNNCSVIDDLRDVALESGGTFYLFYDKYQMIQGQSSEEYELPAAIGDSDCRLSLHYNCRNTREIAQTSVTPLRDKKNRAVKFKTACSWVDPIKPVMHIVDDDNQVCEQINAILNKYKENNVEDVVILTPGSVDYSVIADKLEEGMSNGFYIYKYLGKKYKVTTCRKFKGLEADAVIMIDLNKNSFDGKKGKLFYVGTSRAKHYLDIVCRVKEDEINDIIKELAPGAGNVRGIERQLKTLGNAFGVKIER